MSVQDVENYGSAQLPVLCSSQQGLFLLFLLIPVLPTIYINSLAGYRLLSPVPLSFEKEFQCGHFI